MEPVCPEGHERVCVCEASGVQDAVVGGVVGAMGTIGFVGITGILGVIGVVDTEGVMEAVHVEVIAARVFGPTAP